uniref:Uncharacterized protein n=1 Tax=Setaria italica TaxID=4555 RepID=K4API1_SETIT
MWYCCLNSVIEMHPFSPFTLSCRHDRSINCTYSIGRTKR